MLNFLYEFLPVLLFFIAFKFYGIYVATVVGIVVTALQVAITTLWFRRIDKKQIITLVIFLLFGGMTLYFHDPIFIKWKPTIIFGLFAVILFFSHFIGKKPLMQRLFEPVLESKGATLPVFVWKRLNAAWMIIFALLSLLNIAVAYSFSTDTWVNFKLFGVLGLLLFFGVLQGLYISKHLKEPLKNP